LFLGITLYGFPFKVSLVRNKTTIATNEKQILDLERIYGKRSVRKNVITKSFKKVVI